VEALEERSVPSVTTIDFDHDVDGNIMKAPIAFSDTNPLREIYAFYGAHFSGQNSLDGGAILDQDSNFGVPAHSGRNFLAFNRAAHMANGGVPTDPETIRFDTLPADVTIYVAGGYDSGYFEMDGYSQSGQLVAVNTVTTKDWSPLHVIYSGGIDHVVLKIISQPDNWAVFDDLSFGDGASLSGQLETGDVPVHSGAVSLVVAGTMNPISVQSTTFAFGMPTSLAGGLEPSVTVACTEPTSENSTTSPTSASSGQASSNLSNAALLSAPVGDVLTSLDSSLSATL
jgi:hypothetical protein